MQQRLDALRSRHLYRRAQVVADGSAEWITVDGKRLLNLASNNYLGLATHPKVKAASAEAAEQQGCSAGASRLIAGTSELHAKLEARLAQFKQADRALLFGSGYLANIGVIPALAGARDFVFGDELNHASLIDGCRLSGAEYKTYPHCDVAKLKDLLCDAAQTNPRRRKLVVTDSVFSMDGDFAPLIEISRLCAEHEALLVVDEAHATGCTGSGGRGLIAELGLHEEGTIVISTLSKALGGYGAFVVGSEIAIEYLINAARSFIFTTALPPSVIASASAALDVIEEETHLVERLQRNAEFCRNGLRRLGFDTLASASQIIPVMVGDSARALEMAAALREAGVFVVAIRAPTVPLGAARLRASVMATHTEDDLNFALETFAQVGRRMNLIS